MKSIVVQTMTGEIIHSGLLVQNGKVKQDPKDGIKYKMLRQQNKIRFEKAHQARIKHTQGIFA